MTGIISFFGWRAAAGLGFVAAAAALWIWIGALRGANAALTTERDRLAASLAAEREALALRDRAVAALEAALADARARAAKLRQSRQEVIDAPDADDAPVAPVLRRALDGLRDG